MIAVVAELGDISYFHARNLAAYGLIDFQPELPDLGFRFSIRGPVVGNVFVLASDLAVIAAVAD
jgi:hypothetical protein